MNEKPPTPNIDQSEDSSNEKARIAAQEGRYNEWHRAIHPEAEMDPSRAAAMAYMGYEHEYAARGLLDQAFNFENDGQHEAAELARQDAEEQLAEADLAEQYAAKEYDVAEEFRRQIGALRSKAQSWIDKNGVPRAQSIGAFYTYLLDADYNLSQTGQINYPSPAYDYCRSGHAGEERRGYLAGKNPLDLAFNELRKIGAIGPQDGNSPYDLVPRDNHDDVTTRRSAN